MKKLLQLEYEARINFYYSIKIKAWMIISLCLFAIALQFKSIEIFIAKIFLTLGIASCLIVIFLIFRSKKNKKRIFVKFIILFN